MIEVNEGTYFKIYECINDCKSLDDLIIYTKSFNEKCEDKYWFLDGLVYLTEVNYELYNTREAKERLDKLKELISEKFTYDEVTLLSNISKVKFIKDYIEALNNASNIPKFIDSSEFFKDEKMKYTVIGQVSVGLDLIGCISESYLEDTTLEYKISESECNSIIKNYILSPITIVGFILLCILYALAQVIKLWR